MSTPAVGLFSRPSPPRADDARASRVSDVRYAAYGSNLEPTDLARWCAETGHAMPIGSALRRAWLPDRRPAFSAFGARRRGGVLDVVTSIGAVTACALYGIDDAALEILDMKESRGTLYRRIETVALTDDLEAHPIVTYEILPERRAGHVTPHVDYVDVVRRGLARCGHDGEALAVAATGEAHAGSLRAVFLYGTLLPGECRHHILHEHGLRSIEPATVTGTLIDLGRYPGLLPPRTPESRAHGIVAIVDDIAGLLRRLDRIEGFRGWEDSKPLYWRRLVAASTATGTSPAWTYRYAAPGDDIIESTDGRWSSYNR